MIDKNTEQYFAHSINDNYTAPGYKVSTTGIHPEQQLEYDLGYSKPIQATFFNNKQYIPIYVQEFNGSHYTVPESMMGDFIYLRDQCEQNIDCVEFEKTFAQYKVDISSTVLYLEKGNN